MVDADRQKGRPMEATINLNFVGQEDYSISLVAAGQAETSTTHSVCLGFDRSKREVSLRSQPKLTSKCVTHRQKPVTGLDQQQNSPLPDLTNPLER
jgi:hypothetical protein